MSGPVTFSGLSSGIDTEAIINSLMQVERRPMLLMLERQQEIASHRSILQDLESYLSSLDSSVQSLNLTSTVAAKSATSSNTTALGVSVNATASVGNFSVDSITTLAKAASEASIGVQDEEADFVSGSSFSFDVGTTSYDITLTESQKTLEGLRDAINSEAGDAVTATILNTGDADDPYKLIIRSDETGEDNDISNISTDIVVTTSSGDVALSFVAEESVDAEDAVFKVNGVEISRGDNTVSDAVEGVTLQLKATTASAVTVTVSKDTDTLKSALQDFAEKYNTVNALIQAQFEFDEETGTAGLLSGDANLRQVQSTLHSMIIGGIEDADGNRYSLATIGIEMDKFTGELSLNELTFSEAASNEDADLFLDVLLARGVPSDSRVSYVTSSSETEAGDYSINVSGYDGEGNVEGTFTINGDEYTGVGNGQVLTGPEDSPAEGLRIRIATGATGDLGTVHFTVGVAEQFERQLDEYITPIVGLFAKLDSRMEEDISELSDRIEAFEDRLAITERQLTMQFIAAEQAISTLQNQTSAFQQQLATLG